MHHNRVRRWRFRYLPPGVAVWVTREGFLLQYSSREGYVWFSSWSWWKSDDGQEQKQQVFNLIWEIQMKRRNLSEVSSVQWHVAEDKWLGKYPTFSEFMRAATFEGEEGVRESPTLTVWASGGQWKLSIRDRAEKLVMWLSATNLEELFYVVEEMLGSNDGPWRHDDSRSQDNGKRVRK